MSGVLSLGGGAGRAGGNNTGIWLVLASDVCFGKVTLSGLRTTVWLTVHSWCSHYLVNHYIHHQQIGYLLLFGLMLYFSGK
jgi:hypothetical protein